MKHEFVHCHVHSEFSLLDGASKVKDIVKTAMDNDMPAIALTDHNVMYGTINFYNETQNEYKYGKKIKPLIGYEAYVATNGHLEKSSKEKYNLVLLAQNNKGYKNIVKLVSTGFVDGFYYEPRIDNELLEKYSEGVIALSACLNGEVASSLLRGNFDRARNVAKKYKEI
ncbi:PHP domain-containing protein, partial [bacterium]